MSATNEPQGGPGDPISPPRGGLVQVLYRAHLQRLTGNWLSEIRPRRRHLRSDIVAGLPGAISSVPDGMAASVLAGVNPAHGLYACFAGPIAGGLTSSTRLMVITTTSAAALAAGSAVAPFQGEARSDALLWLTLLVSAVMLVAAALNLSRYIRFVSYSVMLGFLSGIAVNMVLGQLPDLLGVEAGGTLAVAKAWNTLTRLDTADVGSAASGVVALAILVALAKTRAAMLSSLVALALPTLSIALIGAAGVARVEDTGRIPQGLPVPTIPDPAAFEPGLIGGALAVAALMLVQGAGVAEAVPNPAGVPTSTRRDFTAQGIANAAAGVLGGQPVGGSVGQTALGVTAGARTRWAGIWSGVWMGVILLAFSTLVGKVAMPTLAAVLIYAGWGSLRPREVLTVSRAGRIPATAMLTTFAAVLVLPVAQAVGVGVVASLLLQLNQEVLDLRLVRLIRDSSGSVVETAAPSTVSPGEVVVLNAYGSLFYAGARTLQRRLPVPLPAAADAPVPQGGVVVLRLRGRTTLGATFLKVISDYAHQFEEVGGRLYLSGVDPDLVSRWGSPGGPGHGVPMQIYPATPVLGESTTAAVLAAEHPHRVAPHRGSSSKEDAESKEVD